MVRAGLRDVAAADGEESGRPQLDEGLQRVSAMARRAKAGSECAEAEISDGGDERRRARVMIACRAVCSNRQMLKKKCKATLVVFTERRAEGVGRANR